MESNVTTIKLETISGICRKIDNYRKRQLITDSIDLSEMVNISPEFQRSYVWKPRYKTELITSLILGWPIPAVILSAKDDHYEVFDGKQRLTTIHHFICQDDMGVEFKTSDSRLPEELNKKTFNQLPKEVQRRILRYEIPVVRIHMEENDKGILYSRINDNVSRLSSGEIRKGKFLNYKTYQLVQQYAKTERYQKLFKNPATIRRLDHEYHLMRMLTLGTEFSKDIPSLKTGIDDLLSDDFNVEKIEPAITKLDKLVTSFSFTGWNEVKLWIVLGVLTKHEMGAYKKYHKELGEFLKNFETYDIKKENPDLYKAQGGGQYQMALQIYVEKNVAEIFSTKKEARDFKPQLKAFLLSKQSTCEICTEPIDETNMELDHVVPYSKGGKTTVQNLAALCMPCNRKKGSLTLEDLK